MIVLYDFMDGGVNGRLVFLVLIIGVVGDSILYTFDLFTATFESTLLCVPPASMIRAMRFSNNLTVVFNVTDDLNKTIWLLISQCHLFIM